MGIPGTSATQLTKVDLPEKIIKISAGSEISLFLSETNTLYACGTILSSQLNLDGEEPVKSPKKIAENIIELSAGAKVFHVINTKNELLSLGTNVVGEAGTGDDIGMVKKLTKVNIPEKVKAVYSGNFFYCIAVTQSNQFYVWGENFNGEFESSKNNIREPKLLEVNLVPQRVVVGGGECLYSHLTTGCMPSARIW